MWETVLSTGGVALAILLVTQWWEDRREQRRRRQAIRDEPLNYVREFIDFASTWRINTHYVMLEGKDGRDMAADTAELTRFMGRAGTVIAVVGNPELHTAVKATIESIIIVIDAARKAKQTGDIQAVLEDVSLSDLDDSLIDLERAYRDVRQSN